jgi:predicted PurR-regulated permease PerM
MTNDSERIVNLNLTTATRIGLNLLALLGVVVALYLGQTIFIPLVIAVLLAGLAWPSVSWLNRRLRFSWGFSCMLVVGGLVLLNLAVTLGFALAVPNMLQGMPNVRESEGQKELYEIIRDRVAMVWPPDEEYFPKKPEDSKVFRYVQDTLSQGTYLNNVLWYIGYYGNNWLWQWVLVMFILLFLLLEGKMLSRRVVEIFGPSREAQAKAVETLAEMANAVRTYLVWRTLVNFALGAAVGVVYQWVFHLKQPWTWALLTAVSCYVPYLGPIFAGIPPVVDAFLSSPSPWYALGVIVFYIGIITVEGYVLVPVVMGRNMELNATTVMLACLFWELVWGLPGLFLAMPLMAAIKAICAHVPGWRPWANLMSSNDAAPTEKTKSFESLEILDDTQLMSPADAEAIAARRKGLMEKEFSE